MNKESPLTERVVGRFANRPTVSQIIERVCRACGRKILRKRLTTQLLLRQQIVCEKLWLTILCAFCTEDSRSRMH